MAKELKRGEKVKSIAHDCPYILMGTVAAENLKITRTTFNRVNIWKSNHNVLYIDYLDPVEPMEANLKLLFDEIDLYKLKFQCSCPQERIRKFLANRYIMCYDVAGSRFYSNFIPTKNISLLAIPEDQSKLLIAEKLSPSDKRPASPKVLFRSGTLK